MTVPSDAVDFLRRFGPEFENETVRGWQWGQDDSDFGKTVSWDVQSFAPEAGQVVEASASVDLQLTQLTLSISERDMTEWRLANTDTTLIFEALVQFEDRTLTVNGVEREYTEAEVRSTIREFNERVR